MLTQNKGREVGLEKKPENQGKKISFSLDKVTQMGKMGALVINIHYHSVPPVPQRALLRHTGGRGKCG